METLPLWLALSVVFSGLSYVSAQPQITPFIWNYARLDHFNRRYQWDHAKDWAKPKEEKKRPDRPWVGPGHAHGLHGPEVDLEFVIEPESAVLTPSDNYTLECLTNYPTLDNLTDHPLWQPYFGNPLQRPDQRRLNDLGVPMNPYKQPFEMTPERRQYFRTFQFFWNSGPNRFFTGKENRAWEKSPLANRFILHPQMDFGDVFQQDPSYMQHPFFLDPVIIEWTVDNVPLTNQNGTDYWLSPNGTLMLFNLQDYPGSKIRPKEYRCMATNSLGTITSRPAFIGMAFLDKYPIVALKKKVRGVPGNTAVLSCPGDGTFYKPTSAADPLGSVVSRPPPAIQWIKDGIPVNNTRALLMPSGDLQIRDYRHADAGRYQCRLRNMEVERRRNEDWGWEALTHSWRLEQWQQLQDFWAQNPPMEILLQQEREWRKAKWVWNLEQRENRLTMRQYHLDIWEAFRISPPVTLVTDNTPTHLLAFEKLPPTRSANPVRSLVGGTIIFEAIASARPGPVEYEWKGPGGRDLVLDNRTRIINRGNLEIRNVRKSDEGFYRVTATANAETTSHITHLAVNEMPVVTVMPQNHSIIHGAELNITCGVEGLPAYEITWYHNGIELALNLTNRLYIEYTNLTHDGYWQCFIFHEFGVSVGTTRLNVITQPQIMENPDPHIVVHEYEKFTIGCAVGGHPMPSVTWMRNNETLDIHNGTVNDTWSSSTISVAWNLTEIDGEPVVYSTLFVNQTTYNETGQYRCFANNSVGVTASHPSYVEIYGPPRFLWFEPVQFAETGKPKLFELYHAGLPYPQVEWTYPDNVNPGPRFHVLYSGILKIDYVKPTDYGIYNVKLFNKYGMVQTNIGFEVLVQPEVMDVLTPGPPNLGQDYWIVCDMFGKPAPNVTWYKHGEKINGWNPIWFNQQHPRWPWLKYSITNKRHLMEEYDDTWKGMRSNMTIRHINTDDFGLYSCGSLTMAGEYYRRLRVGEDGVTIIPHELDNVPNDVPTWGIVTAVTVGILVLILLLVLVACFAKRLERKVQKENEHRDYMPRKGAPPPHRKRTPEKKLVKKEKLRKRPVIDEPESYMPAYAEEKPQKEARAVGVLKKLTASLPVKEPKVSRQEATETAFDAPPVFKKPSSRKAKKTPSEDKSYFDDEDSAFQMPRVRSSSKSHVIPTKAEPIQMPEVEEPPSNISTSFNYAADATTV